MKTDQYKRFVIYLFSVVGCLSLFVFGFVRLIAGDIVGAVIELSAGVVGVLNVVLLHFFKKERIASSIVLVLMVVVLSFLFISGGIAGTGMFWFFTFPLLAFYMKPLREAFIWMTALLLVVILLFATGNSFFELRTLVQIFASYLAVSMLAYFYAFSNDLHTKWIINKQNELSTSYQNLAKLYQKNQNLQKAAEERAEQSQDQASELEEVKRATLNLLEDLQQEKNKDEAILTSIGDGLFVSDANGKINLVNDAFVSMLGFSENEARGKRMVDLVEMVDEKENLLPEEDRVISIALKTKKLQRTTDNLYFRKKDGSLFPVTVSVAPILSSGTLIGAVGVFRDVTQERAVDRAKTEFVSLASHQLRTPLSAIKWYVELLLSGDFGKLNKEQTGYVNEIAHGSERMIELVGSLLNVSRLELGTFSEEPEPLNLKELVEDIVQEHESVTLEKGITLTQTIDTSIPDFHADRKLLRIVFENLVSNAVKYTPKKGTVSIKLSYESTGKEKRVVYTVSDSGIGIPKGQQESIFKKLFRADNAREGDTDGTGLGLYLVKLIVEKMGGSITFVSKESKGTTFTVILPLRNASTVDVNPEENAHPETRV